MIESFLHGLLYVKIITLSKTTVKVIEGDNAKNVTGKPP